MPPRNRIRVRVWRELRLLRTRSTMQRLNGLWRELIWSERLQCGCPVGLPYEKAGRVLFPLTYAIYLAAGFLALFYGAPALSIVFAESTPLPGPGPVTGSPFDNPFLDAFGIWQILLAGWGLVGYAFKRLWWLEYIGLYLLLAQAGTYAGSLLFLSSDGDATRAYVFAISLVGLVPLIFRTYIVYFEAKNHSAQPFFRKVGRLLHRGGK